MKETEDCFLKVKKDYLKFLKKEKIINKSKITKINNLKKNYIPISFWIEKKYKELKYIDVLKKGLKVMDATAISLCMDNQLPIIVFNMTKKGNIKDKKIISETNLFLVGLNKKCK